MISKKRAAMGLAIGAFIGFLMSDIYVPEKFESPLLYKAVYSYLAIAGHLARFGEAYNYGTETTNIRYINGLLTRLTKSRDEKVRELDTKIHGVKVRLYSPLNAELSVDKPIMVYFHGGGYAIGDLETYDAYLQEFVKRLNMVVISVDYRMAPEHPFPTPIEDCYVVAKHVLHNAEEYGSDSSKVILAGDSAGGNVVATLTQRLLKENEKQPKIQVLIYPWVQMANQLLPSFIKYQNSGITRGAKLTFTKYSSWYMGIKNITQELEYTLLSNTHFLLIDADRRKKIISYLDDNNIPASYKKDRDYYASNEIQKQFMYPNKNELEANSILKQDKELADKLRQVFTPEVSPLFADSLAGLPKAYVLLLEWDSLKDEGILYAERLKQAKVPVKIAFYENAFHAVVSFVKPYLGYKIAKDMQNDLINYLKLNI